MTAQEPRKPLSPEERPGPARESTAGAPSVLMLGPYRVRVATHTWGERKELLQLVADRTPQPLHRFEGNLRMLGDPEARKVLIDNHLDAAYIAQKEWPPQWLSDGFFAAIGSPDNLADVLSIVLRRFNAEVLPAIQGHLAALLSGAADPDPNFYGQIQDVFGRFLYGPAILTRESVKESADPKAEGAASPQPSTPRDEGESIATSPRPTAGPSETSTP